MSIDYLFGGIDNLTSILKDRDKAVDMFNNFSLKYNVKYNSKFKDINLYKTFYRYSTMYVYKNKDENTR